jgi:hypothetical protein
LKVSKPLKMGEKTKGEEIRVETVSDWLIYMEEARI